MEGAGLKPLQLANAVGVTSGAVTHWLNGETKTLKAATANRIQQVTGYSANWIISGMGEKLASARSADPVTYTGPTGMARELALVFDMIPETDHLRRARAFALATGAIDAVLRGDAVALVPAEDLKR